jgi:hypothetical protein
MALVETVLKDLVQSHGPVTVRYLKQKTGFKKSIINSVLHRNRHYLKVERSPMNYRNKKPIWSWSQNIVPLPERARKIRVMSTPENIVTEE